ncbi:hypothetical protein Despr_1336 [Desulfobulbus propionicus DSM 2032]|uniref:Replication initiation factor n=1 Tax=Desulfobulbus propionicus (strain ATCC 33891 / DSM 2032 / VKM B-1956 / 1pr3) TaxID=577650 RepID=A0A7U3YLD4_DESPD|nr:hypothetical protein [Desulfobulbus propionicus]ADW17500.1 hypothetical protein Despr_1336 [Desulfobulbus propionicus DSM 2032]
MYYSRRPSKDPLSQKLRAVLQGKTVDLTNIPTFRAPEPDYLQEIPLEDYRYNHRYPFFVHRNAAPIRVRPTEPPPLGPGPVRVRTTPEQPAGPEPQARLTSGLPVVRDSPFRGLDFLKVSFWIEWNPLINNFLGILESMKKQVQDTEKDSIPVIKENGFDWNLYRTGAKMYTFRLRSGDITLMFNRRKANGEIPNCRLEIGSLSCWSPGFFAIYDRVKTFLACYGGKVVKERVSEVHLAADFVGVDIKTTDLENRCHWIALARDEDEYGGLKVTKREPDPEELEFNRHYSNRKFSGITIGSDGMMFRGYDKVLELKRKRATNKQQVFAEIWGVNTYDEQPVTRIEYQLRRPKLREFSDREGNRINTVCDLVNSLKSLWAYLTTEWTRHTESPVNRNHNQTKAKVSEFWQKVQAVVWTGVFGYIRTHAVKHKDIVMLRKQARGILMSVCASLEVEPDDIDKIVYLCKDIIEEDLHAFFEDEAAFREKMITKRNEFRLTLAG